MSDKPHYRKLLLFLLFAELIFFSAPLVAGDADGKEHNVEPLLAKVYRQEDVSKWWVSEKLVEYARFGMAKNFIFAAGI